MWFCMMVKEFYAKFFFYLIYLHMRVREHCRVSHPVCHTITSDERPCHLVYLIYDTVAKFLDFLPLKTTKFAELPSVQTIIASHANLKYETLDDKYNFHCVLAH